MPITQAPSAPFSYIEDDVEGERSNAAYLGGFAELFAKTLYKPYQELLNDPAGYFTRERITEEDFEVMRGKAKAFFERPASYAMDLFTDPVDTVAGTATSVGRGVAGAFGQAGDYLSETSAGDMARDSAGIIPMVVAGGLKMFVEPFLTTFTQEVVGEDGSVRPATAEELASGVFGSVGTAAGLGVYSRLSKAARALPVGVATTRADRIGNLARNITEEFVAENAAFVVQDVITNPEDISLEAITANIASPLNLALATGVGGLRTRSANKRAVNNWLAENIPINNQAAPSIPLAKQLAATADTPLGQIVETIEDIFKSDTWLEAGFRRVANGATIQILNTSQEAFEAVKKRFNPDVVRIEKPASEAIGRSVKLKKNPRLQFEHSFDADLFLAESIDEFSVRTGIDVPTLKKMRTQFEDAARNVEQTVRSEVNQASAAFENDWKNVTSGLDGSSSGSASGSGDSPLADGSLGHDILNTPPPSYTRPKKNWRLKRGATPQWYKQQQGIRTRAMSGAARVARFRPPGVKTP
jgi:sec-independent protein translocase protein TatB